MTYVLQVALLRVNSLQCFIKEATAFMDLFCQTEAISNVAYKLRPSTLRKPETRRQNLAAWGLSSLTVRLWIYQVF